MAIFKLKNKKSQDRVEELRRKRNQLQNEIYAIQKEIDSIHLNEMNPPCKKGDCIKISLDDYVVFMFMSKEIERLVDGICVSGPQVRIWKTDKHNDYAAIDFFADVKEIIYHKNFSKVKVISQETIIDEMNKAFDCIKKQVISEFSNQA